MRVMARGVGLCGLLALGALSACSRAVVPPARTPAGPTSAQRLASADDLVRAGCLDCLIAAFDAYDALRATPAAADASLTGAIRAATLIAVRERELGMGDEGYLQRAKALAAGAVDLPPWIATTLDVADALPVGGGTRSPSSDADLERSRTLRLHFEAWSTTLRAVAPNDPLASYIWLALSCGASNTNAQLVDDIIAPTGAFSTVPLVAFRRAICRTISPDPLHDILARDPRFVEVKYYLAVYDVRGLVRGVDNLDDADRLYAEVYAWHPAWPSLTQAVANIAMTAEDYERAATFYDRTLTVEPHAVDALLGKARALTYERRHVEAIETLDRLMAERWFIGDAHYWRALNLYQLERYDEAWTDVGDAAKLLINVEVPKLAGRIAYARHELEVSRDKFDEAHGRDPQDCEAGYYLGVVLAELRVWPRTADVLTGTATCLEDAEHGYEAEIATIRASGDPPARQAVKIARREQYIAAGRRQMATSWFDIAVAYYNLSRRDEARAFAGRVVDDEQFGERARELLSRLPPRQ
jgi:tetratricopeptide (TPR) repeat protein